MKYKIISRSLIMVVLIAMFGIAPLCFAGTSSDQTSIKKVKQETQELMQALKAYTADQRDEAIQKTKAAIDNLDTRIDALETRIDSKWDAMDKAARENARASLIALRKQRNKVSEWYGSMKSSSVDTWGHVKNGFSNAYSALSDAWEKSINEFGSDQ